MLPAMEFTVGAWDPVVRAVPFLVGAFVLLATALSLIRTMVIPRALPSTLASLVNRGTNRFFDGLARMRKTYPARDRVLAWAGPMSVLTNLLTWLVLFVLAYALMLYGISDESFLVCIVSAGSSLFTLGLVGSPTTDQTYVDFIAAATGPAVIAMLIGFLPTMYSTYLRRETRVTLLDVLSGQPAWGPEILCRASLISVPERLETVYVEWAEWAAQVRLTQTIYPALNRVRSPTAQRHWLISLLAIMDSAALTVSLNSGGNRANAALLLENGASALSALVTQEVTQQQVQPYRRFSRRLRRRPEVIDVAALVAEAARADHDIPTGVLAVESAVTVEELRAQGPEAVEFTIKAAQRPLSLTRSEFDEAVDLLRRAGFPMDRTPDQGWTEFSRLRRRYEFAAYWLAQTLYAPPAPWSGTRTPATPTIWPALAAQHLRDPE